jgi:hypothetical protein
MAITNFLFNPTTIEEAVTLVAAVITLGSKKAGYWISFIFYLALTICVEATGYYFHYALERPNYLVYNAFMLVQAGFFSFLFFSFFPESRMRRIIITALSLFIIFYLYESISNHFLRYNQMSRQLLSGYVVIFACIYYFRLIRQSENLEPLRHAPFWIVTGLFFFYFGTIVMFSFYSQVAKIKLSGNLSFFNLVMGTLNFIQYGAWITGFICRKKQIQSSKQLLL